MPPRTTCEPAPTAQASLKQQAYLRLKRLILAGELKAGTVLSVRQLAAQLEMSRTPVHAAIERLEADGLVTLAPQHGVMVREMSMQDIVNHYQIRQALEPFVLARLAGRLSADQIRQLRRIKRGIWRQRENNRWTMLWSLTPSFIGCCSTSSETMKSRA